MLGATGLRGGLGHALGCASGSSSRKYAGRGVAQDQRSLAISSGFLKNAARSIEASGRGSSIGDSSGQQGGKAEKEKGGQKTADDDSREKGTQGRVGLAEDALGLLGDEVSGAQRSH